MTVVLPEPFSEPREADRLAEVTAATCLEACCRQLGLTSIPLPVPIETWIEHPLGVDFGFEEMSDTAGYAILDRKTIRVADLLSTDEPRLRWTIAHELGHLLLHEPDPLALRPDQPSYHQIYRNDRERQAERFAAALLMPLRPLVSALFQTCDESHVPSGKAIFELSRDTPRSRDLWHSVFIPAICDRFRVSRTGVLFRLGELRLEDGAPFMLPKVLVALST